MNDKELEELNRNVQLAGICREKYIRCALMGITIHPRAPDSCKALARQVAAVGNNLNQLARIANFNGKAEDIRQKTSLCSKAGRKSRNFRSCAARAAAAS